MSNDKYLEIENIAEEQLGNIIKVNKYKDLDLPCDFSKMQKSEWLRLTKHTSESASYYSLTKHFMVDNKVIASYTIDISFNLEYLDEFFVVPSK